VKKKNNNFKNYKDFLSEKDKDLNELTSYDEQDEPPVAGIRSEDYASKENIHNIGIMAEEIWDLLEDGEEVEKEQLKEIKDIFKRMDKLKRQFEEREIKKREDLIKKEEEREEGYSTY